MMSGALAFVNPYLLLALLGLPLLWWLLRAMPPAPSLQAFPGVSILLGLEPPEKTPDRTPWWLLLLRCLIAALLIFAFAEPLLNPRKGAGRTGPVRLIMDGGWTSAHDWEARKVLALDIIEAAAREKRGIYFVNLAHPQPPDRGEEQRTVEALRAELEVLEPAPWLPLRQEALASIGAAAENIWLHDGLDHESAADFSTFLSQRGSVQVYRSSKSAKGLGLVREDGTPAALVHRARSGTEEEVKLLAFATSETGIAQNLGAFTATFDADARAASTPFDVPAEVMNRIGLIRLQSQESAGATALLDARWAVKRVALISGQRDARGQRLLSGDHYVKEALTSLMAVQETSLPQLMEQNGAALSRLDVLIFIDVGVFSPEEEAALSGWVKAGGQLIRFAGPSLAVQSKKETTDSLLPVRLRPGGRDLGGAMSWGTPQLLAPFEPGTPFFGLSVPSDAAVARQVLAEPEIDLPAKTWARLQDGSPLITTEARGAGRLVLFHTSADPRWSTLPLSGIFPQLLKRTINQASGLAGPAGSGDPAATLWSPELLVDGFGRLRRVESGAVPVNGEVLLKGAARGVPPGIYATTKGERFALNAYDSGRPLVAFSAYPAGVKVTEMEGREEHPLKPWLLLAALLLFFIDILAGMALSGKLRRAGAVTAALLAFLMPGPHADAQSLTEQETRAVLGGALAYVITGDGEVDRISEAGLYGLSQMLNERTSVEPADPVGIDIETDDLSIYPLLYWPITPVQPLPSADAVANLNEYMRRGGMILFDTRDADLAIGGTTTPNGRALQRLSQGLELPALAPVTLDHVLTRSFYLIDEFPGRFYTKRLWVEAAPSEGEAANAFAAGFSNDGVSPVVVGGGDWAGAWAIDRAGRPLKFVEDSIRREWAFRFGVNITMYALTGSYKSDQVHIPTLLERLGQ